MPKSIKDIKIEDEKKVADKVPISNSGIKKQLDKNRNEMKEILENQPKVSILIPLEKGEQRGAVQPFTINGYRFTVPKGQMTQVPEQVAEMISERFNIELEVRGRSIGNAGGEVKAALDA